jgi:hypothetical protein
MTRQSERFRSLALAIVLGLGAGGAWGLLVVCAFGVVQNLLPSHEVWGEIVVLLDGTPVARTYHGSGWESAIYRTLKGQPVDVRPFQIGWTDDASLPGPVSLSQPFARISWRERIVPCTGQDYEAVWWYLLYDGELHGHAFLVGYDSRTKRKVGYIGRDGFRRDEVPIKDQFPIDGRKWRRPSKQSYTTFPNSALLEGEGRFFEETFDAKRLAEMKILPPWAIFVMTDDGLVQIDIKNRTVKSLLKDKDMLSIAASGEPRLAADAPNVRRQTILVRTPNRVVVLDPSGKELRTYPLPTELQNIELCWFDLSCNRALVWDATGAKEVFWIDTTGKIIRRETVVWKTPPRPSRVLETSILPSLAVPGPAVGVVAGPFWRPLDEVWPYMLITGATGIVLAWLCYRRQRAYGLSWTGPWVAFVWLFGLPAFFGYLAHRTWPARLPCPHCGRPVPRDRPACFACGRDFPPPAMKGIEVFA